MAQAAAHILIVDDEAPIRMALGDFLELHNHQVSQAASASEAINILQGYDIDLVITDIMMPGMKGTKLMEEVHRTDPYMPFVLMTAYPSLEAAIICMQTGAIDYISKPFEFKQIEQAVIRGLKKRDELMQLSHSTANRDRRIPTGYKCLRTLGQGSMGDVFLVRKTDNSKARYALKSLHLNDQNLADQRRAVRRFGREVRAAGMVDHPNIVKVLDYGSTKDFLVPYVVMEYVPGHPLSFLIDHDALEQSQRLHILERVGSALGAIHEVGILHRDVKPSNILLTADLVPKVSDFGIARLPMVDPTQADIVLGSPSYMAPEAFRQQTDVRSDIFSFGATAYELLEGRRLFEGSSLAEIMGRIVDGPEIGPEAFERDYSAGVIELVLRCLRKQPEQRFQTTNELLQELRQLR